MFKRKITCELIKWYENPNRKSLIVEGARQVGKTFIINQFANDYYNENVITLNFLENPTYKTISEGNLSADTLFQK